MFGDEELGGDVSHPLNILCCSTQLSLRHVAIKSFVQIH